MPAKGAPRATASRLLYGAFAWAYDLVVEHPAGGSSLDMAGRVRSLGVPAGSLVVDAGCGTGRYAQALAEAGFNVVGIDRSAALVEQARQRLPGARFVCADLLTWRPRQRAAGVLCRGVLNDLTDDGDRCAAFSSFAAWLARDGVLVADVRDWHATAARYARQQTHRASVQRSGCALEFSSLTRLDDAGHLMHVRERYTGTVSGTAVDDSSEFVMRCWTAEEVRHCAAEAGFASLDIQRGADAGIAADRLLLVARR